jgi:hypothetical protein
LKPEFELRYTPAGMPGWLIDRVGPLKGEKMAARGDGVAPGPPLLVSR